MLTGINNAKVINEKVSKIKNLLLHSFFFLLKFNRIVFLSASIISAHLITESTIILAKYLRFS